MKSWKTGPKTGHDQGKGHTQAAASKMHAAPKEGTPKPGTGKAWRGMSRRGPTAR